MLQKQISQQLHLKTFLKAIKGSTVSIFIAVACIGSIVSIQHHRILEIRTKDTTKEEYTQAQKRLQVSLSLLNNLSSNNFSNLIANWSFLEFLQYFGDDDARQVTGYSLNPEFLASVVHHDPRFVEAYLFMSSPITLYSGRPDQNVALMSKGLKSLSPVFPNAYYVWLYKATDQLLFLGDTPGARQSYLMTADWAKKTKPVTEETKRVAASAQETAEFLEHNPQSKPAQISAWLMILSNARDDQKVQVYVINQLRRLGVKVNISETGEIEFSRSSL